MVEQVIAEEVAVKKIPGFVAKGRIRRFECEWLEPEEGAEPFWADINVKMTIDEVDAFGELLSGGARVGEAWPWLAPRVVAWNAMAYDIASGEYVPVPPPAEGGEASFRAVESVITSWLAFSLKSGALGGDLKKEETPSGSTPEPASGSGSGSGTRPANSRRNRKG